MCDVKGMESARRAVEIAAAGSHALLLIGPPGAGKSMLAARIPGLLPDLDPRSALEVSMIHSVAGLLDGGRLVMRPPFREPHHSASQAALYARRSNRCASRWRPAKPPSPAPPRTSPIRRGFNSWQQ
jgi:magnesium chelatase family protein